MNTLRTYHLLRTTGHMALVVAVFCAASIAHTASGCDIASPCRTAMAADDAACTCGGGEGGCCATEPSGDSGGCCATKAEPVAKQGKSSGCCSATHAMPSDNSPVSAAPSSNCPCSISVPDAPVVPARELNPAPVGKRAQEACVLALAELAPFFTENAESLSASSLGLPPPESPRLDILCRYLC